MIALKSVARTQRVKLRGEVVITSQPRTVDSKALTKLAPVNDSTTGLMISNGRLTL